MDVSSFLEENVQSNFLTAKAFTFSFRYDACGARPVLLTQGLDLILLSG